MFVFVFVFGIGVVSYVQRLLKEKKKKKQSARLSVKRELKSHAKVKP